MQFQKISIPPDPLTKEENKICWLVGGSKYLKNVSTLLEIQDLPPIWKFSRGVGGLPSVEEVWIFSGTAQSQLQPESKKCYLREIIYMLRFVASV